MQKPLQDSNLVLLPPNNVERLSFTLIIDNNDGEMIYRNALMLTALSLCPGLVE